LERLVIGRGANDASAIKSAKQLSSLTVSLTSTNGKVLSISEEAMGLLESRDEAYSLTVPGDGSAASLTANSTLGLFRGLTTFGQLWYEYGGATYTLEAPIKIHDAPTYVRFRILLACLEIEVDIMLWQPYRGLMLDTARN
jgi:hexosaminidase